MGVLRTTWLGSSRSGESLAPKLRVLLDTNVLISAILFRGLPREFLYLALRGNIDLVTSPTLMSEFQEVLSEKFGFTATEARALRTEMELIAESQTPKTLPNVVRDRDDNEVLAAAELGGADVIITGDKDLLSLGSYAGIKIVSPRMFRESLEGGEHMS